MNEPANFFNRPYPGNNTTPEASAEAENDPPEAPFVREGLDAPISCFPASLQPKFATGETTNRTLTVTKRSTNKGRRGRGASRWSSSKRHWGQGGHGKAGGRWQHGGQTGSGCGDNECKGLPNREIIRPPYMIQNGAGPTLADGTADTDIVQPGYWTEYDTHNIYGAMMSTHSHNAMHNLSEWFQYRFSISQILQMASLYQIPVVGPDVCGFGGNVTETLCARWFTLGAMAYPFYRNHAEISSTDQEAYRWPLVAEAARNAMSIRYQLLDYLYTAVYKQNQTGLPALNPPFFNYSEDTNTYAIDSQLFLGDGILVSPVTEENSPSVEYYLPEDIFYEWGTGKPVRGEGEYVTAEFDFNEITVHYKGGIIYPQCIESANTTTALRTKGFTIVIAPGLAGNAVGPLYLDDGVSVVQDTVFEIDFKYEDGKFSMTGSFEHDAGVNVETITLLDMDSKPEGAEDADCDEGNKTLVPHVDAALTGKYEATIP